MNVRTKFKVCSLIYPFPESEEVPPPARGMGVGGSRVTMLRGLMLRMIFSSFLMFSKFLYKYSCIMKSTGSVLYLFNI